MPGRQAEGSAGGGPGLPGSPGRFPDGPKEYRPPRGSPSVEVKIPGMGCAGGHLTGNTGQRCETGWDWRGRVEESPGRKGQLAGSNDCRRSANPLEPEVEPVS